MFSGHNHFYERSQYSGVHHIVTGGGGATENTWYYYDKAGQLEYIHYDTLAGGQDLKFSYDGLGRRIVVERGTATVSSGQVTGFSVSETRKFAYLGGSVIQELNSSDQVVKEYMRGLDLGGGIGGIIYQKKGADYYYYHYNHKGDVAALTDGNGELAAYYEYDAWGNTMTEAQKSGVDNLYRYSTKEWDQKSGLYYFGARYYYPEIGRWTQRDPAGLVDGLNLYAYVRNNPVSRYDPWGHSWWDYTEEEFAFWSVCTLSVHVGLDKAWEKWFVKTPYGEFLEKLPLQSRLLLRNLIIAAAAATACDHYISEHKGCLSLRDLQEVMRSARATITQLLGPEEDEKPVSWEDFKNFNDSMSSPWIRLQLPQLR